MRVPASWNSVPDGSRERGKGTVNSMKRFPAVADRFYPGDPVALVAELGRLVPETDPLARIQALAVVSPHAGYVYSGAVAGATFARVEIPGDVVILGPNHHGQGAEVAVMEEGSWQMPLGEVSVNTALAQTILRQSPLFTVDDLAHRFEHSLEVQVPFLQYLRKDVTIVPIAVSHLSYQSCLEAGRALSAAIWQYGRPVLLVASTDMTHYESRESAEKKDLFALGFIERLDPEGLYTAVRSRGITMCGIMPTTMALIATLEMGGKQVDLVRYTDSGAVSGDIRQVVGYAGLIIS